jgi:hypothetical protein
MIKETIESIQNSLSERVTNPLIGSFAITWCICNWDLIAVIFVAAEPMSQRLELVKARQLTDWHNLNLHLVPFVGALIYVLGMPWLALLVDSARSKPHLIRKRHRADLELSVLEIRKELVCKRAAVQEEQNQLDERETRLKKREEEIEERELSIERRELQSRRLEQIEVENTDLKLEIVRLQLPTLAIKLAHIAKIAIGNHYNYTESTSKISPSRLSAAIRSFVAICAVSRDRSTSQLEELQKQYPHPQLVAVFQRARQAVEEFEFVIHRLEDLEKGGPIDQGVAPEIKQIGHRIADIGMKIRESLRALDLPDSKDISDQDRQD